MFSNNLNSVLEDFENNNFRTLDILISENIRRVAEVPEDRKKVNMVDIFTEEKSED